MKIRKPMHDNWETPVWLLEMLTNHYFNGEQHYDPCPINHKVDALNKPWKKNNFVNPPYSRVLKEAFIRKSYKESLKGNLVVMLLPVSTSTKIFHEIIYPNAEIVFLKGRVKFKGINTKGETVSDKAGMHDSMLVIFRPPKKSWFKRLVTLR